MQIIKIIFHADKISVVSYIIGVGRGVVADIDITDNVNIWEINDIILTPIAVAQKSLLPLRKFKVSLGLGSRLLREA